MAMTASALGPPVAQIVVPTVVDERQRALFGQLKESSTFNPRAHMS